MEAVELENTRILTDHAQNLPGQWIKSSMIITQWSLLNVKCCIRFGREHGIQSEPWKHLEMTTLYWITIYFLLNSVLRELMCSTPFIN